MGDEPMSYGETASASLPMRLLAAGIPVTLLWDLVDPQGPDSRWLVSSERRSPRLAT